MTKTLLSLALYARARLARSTSRLQLTSYLAVAYLYVLAKSVLSALDPMTEYPMRPC